MFNPKLIFVCILCLIFLSCNRTELIIYEGSNSFCLNLSEVLDVYQIQNNRFEKQDRCYLYVKAEDFEVAKKVFNVVAEFRSDLKTRDENKFLNRFIPVIKSNSDDLKPSLRILENIPGVFKLGCEPTEDPKKKFSCVLWYHSSIVPLEDLKKTIENSGLVSTQFKFNDISPLIALTAKTKDSKPQLGSNLVVLDPFTFHVPTMEKDVAGIQLILVLGVFLLSGFVLGYWIALREKQ